MCRALDDYREWRGRSASNSWNQFVFYCAGTRDINLSPALWNPEAGATKKSSSERTNLKVNRCRASLLPFRSCDYAFFRVRRTWRMYSHDRVSVNYRPVYRSCSCFLIARRMSVGVVAACVTTFLNEMRYYIINGSSWSLLCILEIETRVWSSHCRQ